MLKLNDPVTTPPGLRVAGTVWRWVGLSIDAGRAAAQIVLAAYPSVEIAAAVGTPAALPPLIEERYQVTGAEFGTIVLSPPAGPTLSDAVSTAIYRHIRATVPRFADAEDVELPTAG